MVNYFIKSKFLEINPHILSKTNIKIDSYNLK